MIHLHLPYPPSVNHLYSRSRYGVYLKPEAKKYRRQVTDCVLEQVGITKPLEGDVMMTLALYPPDAKRRDIDNGLKIICDSIQHAGLLSDDSQIKHLVVSMHPKEVPGNAYVSLERLQ